jgi:hypothetical protein
MDGSIESLLFIKLDMDGSRKCCGSGSLLFIKLDMGGSSQCFGSGSLLFIKLDMDSSIQCCGQCCGTVTIYYGSGSGSSSDF